MIYSGTIVEESLLDNRILNSFTINQVHISMNEVAANRWHLYKVTLSEKQIDILLNNLKPQGWYAHFWHNDKVIVVFPGKKFKIQYSDKSTWQDAIDYGLSIGIPQEQLDFPTDDS